MTTETSLIIGLIAINLAATAYLVSRAPRAKIRSKRSSILIDTSVLMDGRIVAIAKSGFLSDTVVIPRSVVGELQFLADNADADKRARARFGLDVVSELQAMPSVTVELLQDGSKASEGVDERLLSLAKANSAALCTIDFNLNKVALVEGIRVLNVNELAQSLRMAHLPGEIMTLSLVQKGQDSHQAVGYLDDGTMVVVEHANGMIGKAVQVEIIRSLQTAAGKMMFAKLHSPSLGVNEAKKPTGTRPSSGARKKSLKVSPSPKQAHAPEASEAPRRRHQNNVNTSKTREALSQKSSARKSRSPQAQREAAMIDLIERQ